MQIAQTKIVPISEVKLNDDNPRYIKDEKFQKLLNSIDDLSSMMQMREIMVDENMVAIGGNMRLRACIRLGWTEVPIKIYTRELAEEDIKKRKAKGSNVTYEDLCAEMIIKDNVAYGEWDWEIVGNNYDQDDLVDWGLDVPDVTSTTHKEAEEDDYEPTAYDKIKTDIVLGDIFEIGPHKLICGDSTQTDTYAALFQDKLADLVVTDPPYNVNYEGGTGMTIQNDDMEDSAFYNFLYDFHVALMAYTKDGGAWYVWHADSEGLNFRKAFIEAGLELKQCLIWVKNALVMGRQDYQWKHEPCLYGWKPGAAHYFTSDRTNTTVIEDVEDYEKMTKKDLLKIVEEIMSDKTKTTILRHDKPRKNDVHPTMKPIKLIGELIANSSTPGELVADGFLGSGSTMVASHQLGRTCYGVELDPKYCQVILERMQALDPDLTIKRNGKKYTL